MWQATTMMAADRKRDGKSERMNIDDEDGDVVINDDDKDSDGGGNDAVEDDKGGDVNVIDNDDDNGDASMMIME